MLITVNCQITDSVTATAEELNKQNFVLEETAKYLMALAGWKTTSYRKTADVKRTVHLDSRDAQFTEEELTETEEPLSIHKTLINETTDQATIAAAVFGSTPKPAVAPPPPGQANHSGSDVVLDANGLPWDKRIHARTKSFAKDGSWKIARNVKPAQVRVVEAELRNVMTMSGPAAVTAGPAQGVYTLETPVHKVAPPPPGAPAPAANGYPALMRKVSAAVQAKQITHAEFISVIKARGFEHGALIPSRPDFIPEISAEIDALIAR